MGEGEAMMEAGAMMEGGAMMEAGAMGDDEKKMEWIFISRLWRAVF